MRDAKSSALVVHSISSQNITADTDGASADLLNYDGALVIANYGLWQDGTSWTLTIEESDDDSSFSTATDVVGTATAVTGTGDDNTSDSLAYIGSKRYIRAHIELSGSSSSGLQVSANIIKMNPKVAPAA